MKDSKMGHDNHAISDSTVTLHMPQEPRGSYRGSNEFIRKYLLWHSSSDLTLRFICDTLVNCQCNSMPKLCASNQRNISRMKEGHKNGKKEGHKMQRIYAVGRAVRIQWLDLFVFHCLAFCLHRPFIHWKWNVSWCGRCYCKFIAIESN